MNMIINKWFSDIYPKTCDKLEILANVLKSDKNYIPGILSKLSYSAKIFNSKYIYLGFLLPRTEKSIKHEAYRWRLVRVILSYLKANLFIVPVLILHVAMGWPVRPQYLYPAVLGFNMVRMGLVHKAFLGVMDFSEAYVCCTRFRVIQSI